MYIALGAMMEAFLMGREGSDRSEKWKHCVERELSVRFPGLKLLPFDAVILLLFFVIHLDFQSGISFAVALTKDGKLYEWIGEWQPELRNEFGENTEITKIAAGVYHVMALTACGKVFCWGSNITGQVGIGSTMEIQQNPRKIIPATDIDIDQKIVSIACGTSSSFAIGQDGDVIITFSGVFLCYGCTSEL